MNGLLLYVDSEQHHASTVDHDVEDRETSAGDDS
jgi:hypothetical protein